MKKNERLDKKYNLGVMRHEYVRYPELHSPSKESNGSTNTKSTNDVDEEFDHLRDNDADIRAKKGRSSSLDFDIVFDEDLSRYIL